MTSAETALSLVDKTEANIKLIEQISETFLAPVLNEWRYAIRHVLTSFAKNDPSGEDAQKAVSHLKRAYFDSCDIVLDCQLDALSLVHERCLGYAEAVVKVAPAYTSWLETMRNAQRLHREAQAKHDDEREAAFDSLAPTIKELDEILDKLSFRAEEISATVRRAKANARTTIAAKIAGIAVAALTLVKAIFFATRYFFGG